MNNNTKFGSGMQVIAMEAIESNEIVIDMFSGLGGNSESNMPNGMPGSIEEMQKMMGKLPMGGGANKFSGMGLPGFSGKPSKRIK